MRGIDRDRFRIRLERALRRGERPRQESSELHPSRRRRAWERRILRAARETNGEHLEDARAGEQVVEGVGVGPLEDRIEPLIERGRERAGRVVGLERGLTTTSVHFLAVDARCGRVLAQHFVGGAVIPTRSMPRHEGGGRDRARAIDLERAEQVFELELLVARARSTLRGRDVRLARGARAHRLRRPSRERTEQLVRKRIVGVLLGRGEQRLLRAGRVARARMQHRDAHEHRRRLLPVLGVDELAELRSGEPGLAKPLEPTGERATELGVGMARSVGVREPAHREIDGDVELRVSARELRGEPPRALMFFRRVAEETRELDPRPELRLFRVAPVATNEGFPALHPAPLVGTDPFSGRLRSSRSVRAHLSAP